MRKPGPAKRPRRSRAGRRPLRPSTVTSDRCLYCDCPLVLSRYDQPDKLTLDHIIPKDLGGTGHGVSDPNVALSCLACNHAKANRTASEAMALGLIPTTERAIAAEHAALKHLGHSVDIIKEPS